MAKKPYTKYPKHPISKWPPSGGTPFEATPWDNWWTAADYCGRENVWDVIYFNFQTTDPAEVNWYLENLLGCTKMDKKKQNYGFGRKDGAPIYIYLPDPGWKRDPGVVVPPKPVRPAMDLGDLAAAQLALSVLGSVPISRINFHIGGYHIKPLDFRKVADRIRSGTFAVYSLPASSAAAKYDPEANALHIRFGWHVTELAKIVHEAVHAVFDLKKAHNIFSVDDEAAAYLAESIFAQAYVAPTRHRQLVGGDARTGDIFMEAYKLAMMALDGVEIVDADFEHLREKIATHPEYAGGARNVAGYDGVYEMGPV